MSEIKKRSELLFCYDIKDANPNGDPMDDNKPRVDEETKINIVTDVRLKRTIRDYLYEYKGYNGKNGKDIFVREIPSDMEGHIQDAKLRAKDYLKEIKEDSLESLQKGIDIINENVISECIDVRLFGATIPIELKIKKKAKGGNDEKEKGKAATGSITHTGPVQFKIGRSLHPVELKHMKGTGAFASGENKSQATFRDEYVLPYSFIAFHGIINETAAKHTKLTESDVAELIDAIWNGTKNLISRSKFGQMPRFLLKVTYKNEGFFIGDLDKFIKITECKNPYKIRGTEDFELNIDQLLDVFTTNKDKIDSVEYRLDTNVKTSQSIPADWKQIEV